MNRSARAARASVRKEEVSEVVSFSFDAGEDDHEEIRRRRYSSSSASDSEEERRCARERRAKARRSAKSQRELEENEWERASTGSIVESSSSDEESDERIDFDHVVKKPQTEEPESPRRTKRNSQQSDEDGTEYEDDDDGSSSKPATAAAKPNAETNKAKAAATTTAASPSTIIKPSTATPVDLSRVSKLAVYPGSELQLVEGHVIRVKTLLQSQYLFYVNDKLLLMADKQIRNRTSNFHLFDMTRSASAVSSRLTKKSGNYIGKLRSSFSRRKNVLLSNHSRKTELGAILFSSTANTAEPRKVTVILPTLSSKTQEINALAVGDRTDAFSVLLDQFLSLREGKEVPVSMHHYQGMPAPTLQVFENKEPVFENGFYRLNFNRRVSVPSVKNFQLVRAAEFSTASSPSLAPMLERGSASAATVCLQFGKVDEQKFHLDFRAPITPIQAFAIALAQCNL